MVHYEIFAHQLPWPTDWTAVYGRQAPLLIEIGFGGGHFLRDLAQTRPEANVVGVEISLPSIRRGLKKLMAAGLANGRVVQTTADYLLWACCAPESIAEVYINFPDPWPKKGQRHRRLIDGRFLNLLATRMLPEGKLEIATDHADYAEAISRCLAETPYFKRLLTDAYTTEDKERLLRTKYEKIALQEGRICHYFKWRRQGGSLPNNFEQPKELPMPHVVLNTPVELNALEGSFDLENVEKAGVHVNYLALFHNSTQNVVLVETYIKEEPLAQRIGLTIRRRDEESLVIGVSEIGFPRPTWGVQLAISTLTKWLMTLDDEAKIISKNLAAGL